MEDNIQIVEATITNLDRLCRTCLGEKEESDLNSVFDNSLDEMLLNLTSIKVSLEDGLPTVLCAHCTFQLRLSYSFKEQCIRSEMQLREALCPPPESEIDKLILNTVTEDKIVIKTDILETELLKGKTTEKERNIEKRLREIPDRLAKQEKNYTEPENELEVTETTETDSNEELISADGCEFVYTESNFIDTEKFNSFEENDEYIKIHGNPPSYQCKECQKIFKFEGSCQLHVIRHKEIKQCSMCDQSFKLMKQLYKHLQLEHPDYKPHVCEICDGSFTTASTLVKHMRIHGGEKKHLCTLCGKRFFEPNHLTIHIRTHTGERPVVCDVCGKKFADTHGLAAHSKIHTGERKYECTTCGKKFAHSFVLRAHYRVHSGEKPYICSICGAAFATSSYLTIHTRTHTQERPYKCTSCPKAFISKCGLAAHTMTHTGEKRFQCEVCSKWCARAADLAVHMRSHTGEKPYSCDQCKKRYHTSSNLAAHKRTHSGIKNHSCEVCNKSFGDKRTLKCHLRTHTGERPYLCTVCGNRYTQSGQLAAHRRTHGITPKRNRNIVNEIKIKNDEETISEVNNINNSESILSQ